MVICARRGKKMTRGSQHPVTKIGLSVFRASKSSQVTVAMTNDVSGEYRPFPTMHAPTLTIPDFSGAATFDRLSVVVSREDLDPRAVLAVDASHVADVDVGNNVWNAIVLTQGTDGDSVGSVAVHVFDGGEGRVGLEGYAVIAVDDGRVADDDVVGSVGVPCQKVRGETGVRFSHRAGGTENGEGDGDPNSHPSVLAAGALTLALKLFM
jgi:hypothetical protein